MKRAKHLRTLEQLWDLEDRHPLVDASVGGLLRWMLATGMLAASASDNRTVPRRRGGSARHVRNGRP